MPIFKVQADDGTIHDIQADDLNGVDDAMNDYKTSKSILNPQVSIPSANTSSPQSSIQTPGVKGTGALNNPAINAAEKFAETATPYGSTFNLVNKAANDQLLGTPGNRALPIAQTGLDLANVGLSFIPGLGGASDAAVKGLLASNLGSGIGAAAPGLAASSAQAHGLPGVAKALNNPIVQLGTTMAGGLGGASLASPSITSEKLPDTAYGQLTPAQIQIQSGEQGLTPEIEREALNRNSNPMQMMARDQAQSMQGNLTKTLGEVAPIQEPTAAAAALQTKFGGAQKAASNAMSNLDQLIAAADTEGTTTIDGQAVKNSVMDAIRDAGWPVNKAGEITAGKTTKGFSGPVKDVLQSYLDELDNVESVGDLRNLRQNFGQEIYQASKASGVPADIPKNAVYGALSQSEQNALPPAIADALKKQNSIYSGLANANDVDALGKPLQKDPTKLWDSMIGAGNSDKDWMNNVQNFMKQTGIGTQDLKSVAVSNIAQKVQNALNNPAKDNIGQLTQGINALEQEVNRIPANARAGLLGDAYPQLQTMIADGQTIRAWANKLPQNSQTAVLGAAHGANWLANGVEGIMSKIPGIGSPIGAGLGAIIRKGGSVANDASMNNYLQGAKTVTPPVLGLPPWLAGLGIGASQGLTAMPSR